MTPPIELLQTGWFPFISSFYWRAVPLLRAFRRIQVSSWFRSSETNRDVGGSPESQHLFALGWDLVGSQGDLRAAFSMARRLGLHPTLERDHLHIQSFPAGALARAGVRFPA